MQIQPEVKAQIISRAKEAGFPGHIEFRIDMPFDGFTDKMVFPDEQVTPLMRKLRRELPPEAKGKPVIYLRVYLEKTKRDYLAVLAHEIGHYEQPLPEVFLVDKPHWVLAWIDRETDAQIRGFPWAKKWGVLPEYMDFLRRMDEFLKMMGFPLDS